MCHFTFIEFSSHLQSTRNGYANIALLFLSGFSGFDD
jgi:hypothetical protein